MCSQRHVAEQGPGHEGLLEKSPPPAPEQGLGTVLWLYPQGALPMSLIEVGFLEQSKRRRWEVLLPYHLI